MKKALCNLIFISTLMSVSMASVFAESQTLEPKGFNPTPHILHHIADSYEWHLWGNVSIPLPVILYSEGNWDVFMSSDFHHGESKVVVSDRIYMIDLDHNSKTYHQIVEENDKSFLNISITKNVASMFLSTLILLLILGFTTKGYKNKRESPKGLQSFIVEVIEEK